MKFLPLIRGHKNTAKRYLRLAVETFSDFVRCCVVCVSVLLVYPGRLGFIPGWGGKSGKNLNRKRAAFREAFPVCKLLFESIEFIVLAFILSTRLCIMLES
ncbi:hypothetical protein [Sutcliffiella sp. FSL R7-0096]|uniref:hypothetical protein n=1 Tax=Sutcliffiella sp. FSL R7-0096 TaxID=2921670 RepID=UPI00315A71FB